MSAALQKPAIPPVDFSLVDPEQKLLAQAFAGQLYALVWVFTEELEAAGLQPAEAVTVCVDRMVRMAAEHALAVRKVLLKGEPDRDRWQAVTADAFDHAVHNFAGWPVPRP